MLPTITYSKNCFFRDEEDDGMIIESGNPIEEEARCCDLLQILTCSAKRRDRWNTGNGSVIYRHDYERPKSQASCSESWPNGQGFPNGNGTAEHVPSVCFQVQDETKATTSSRSVRWNLDEDNDDSKEEKSSVVAEVHENGTTIVKPDKRESCDHPKLIETSL